MTTFRKLVLAAALPLTLLVPAVPAAADAGIVVQVTGVRASPNGTGGTIFFDGTVCSRASTSNALIVNQGEGAETTMSVALAALLSGRSVAVTLQCPQIPPPPAQPPAYGTLVSIHIR